MTRIASMLLALSWLFLAPSAFANSAIDHVHATAVTVVGVPGDILTEGSPPGPPAPPVVSIPALAIGLLPGDEIDALSFGNDPIGALHQLTFSVGPAAVGVAASGVAFEVGIGTPPSAPIPLAIPKPPEAAGDIFLQTGVLAGPCTNVLAPAGAGYGAGSGTGDEFNATWATPVGVLPPADDLDALEYSDPVVPPPGGVYFSLAPGSPSLPLIPATAGDILYSPLGGGPVVIALLLGAGPATDVALGIPGANLDALNLIALGPGVIAPGLVGPSPCGPPAGTHLTEYSIAPGGLLPPGAVLVRIAPGIAGVKVAPVGLGLAPADNLDALEAVVMPPAPPPVPAASTPTLMLIAATLVGIGAVFARRWQSRV